MELVAYYRVSTDRQRASGLGLEAQREAVARYAAQQSIPIIAEYVEAESGALKDRPQLNAALAICRKRKAVLCIAKLDRLARNVAFVSALMETGVEFVAVDAPYANRLMIHILSAFAQHEREQISERTRAALAAAKARGVILGANGAVLGAAAKQEADRFARTMKPHIAAARDAGHTTLRDIGAYLIHHGVSAPSGPQWHPSTLSRIITRIGQLSAST